MEKCHVFIPSHSHQAAYSHALSHSYETRVVLPIPWDSHGTHGTHGHSRCKLISSLCTVSVHGEVHDRTRRNTSRYNALTSSSDLNGHLEICYLLPTCSPAVGTYTVIWIAGIPLNPGDGI